jgi:hypothetical protein
MDKNNPTGTGSFSMGRREDSEIGDCSHTEGYDTVASQLCSHAEGYHTEALGDYSHAEGSHTIAFGEVSHAEGASTQAFGEFSHAEGTGTAALGGASHSEGAGTIALGGDSHAEGSSTVAFGEWSHAEGYSESSIIRISGEANSLNYTSSATNRFIQVGAIVVFEGYNDNDIWSKTAATITSCSGLNFTTDTTLSSEKLTNKPAQIIIGSAIGMASHKEGFNTIASGDNSHAEGWKTIASGYSSHAEGADTVAAGYIQHVQGEFNIPDSNDDIFTKGKYAHIVGNGTSDTDRSNAHTLDWNGVGWFQGGLQVGGNAQDDGAKNVLLEGTPQNYIILNDAVTGAPYKIEIRNGNLVSSFMASLDDFTYTTNDDGTKTITGWNETHMGEPSTEMIVPIDNSIII